MKIKKIKTTYPDGMVIEIEYDNEPDQISPVQWPYPISEPVIVPYQNPIRPFEPYYQPTPSITTCNSDNTTMFDLFPDWITEVELKDQPHKQGEITKVNRKRWCGFDECEECPFLSKENYFKEEKQWCRKYWDYVI